MHSILCIIQLAKWTFTELIVCVCVSSVTVVLIATHNLCEWVKNTAFLKQKDTKLSCGHVYIIQVHCFHYTRSTSVCG